MPITTMIELAGIVTAFAAFASTLAWAQLRARRPAIARETTRPRKRRAF